MTITAESLTLNLVNFRTQMLNSLTDATSSTGSSFGDILSQLQAGGTADASAQSLAQPCSAGDLLAVGSNASANGINAGEAMMTTINGLDITYKAQFSALNQMESNLPQLQAAAQQLGTVNGPDGSDTLRTRLEDFAQQYNAWVQRFSPDMQQGGVLANTQAAEVSVYELKQSITNPFVGAKDGFNGLSSMGITIDPNTGLLSVDSAQLGSAWANNQQGVVDAISEFSANFSTSAGLLASNGNIVRDQLNNLGSAIGYIDGNAAALQKEFGNGAAADSTGQVAQALAAYNSTSGI